jgi:vacuolar-type H+-ATPase subunit I/STV1
MKEIQRNLNESKQLMKTSKIQLRDYLVQINHIARPLGNDLRASNVEGESISATEVYKFFVAKERAIYSALNYMRQGPAAFVGYFWSPTEREEEIRSELRAFPTSETRRYDNHNIKPPTYLKTNEFTGAF